MWRHSHICGNVENDVLWKEENDVHHAIMSLKTKTCELDPVPTTIFKMLLTKILPLITKIVNLSLCQGQFIQDWKTAIV